MDNSLLWQAFFFFVKSSYKSVYFLYHKLQMMELWSLKLTHDNFGVYLGALPHWWKNFQLSMILFLQGFKEIFLGRYSHHYACFTTLIQWMCLLLGTIYSASWPNMNLAIQKSQKKSFGWWKWQSYHRL